jgi:hypothetical protein
LDSDQAAVDFVSNTKTRTGLKIKAKADAENVPTGVEIPAAATARLNLKQDLFHGDWKDALLRH